MAYENIIIAVVIIGVLIFGAKKIPELAKTFGKAKGEFEKGKIEAEKEQQESNLPSSKILPIPGA